MKKSIRRRNYLFSMLIHPGFYVAPLLVAGRFSVFEPERNAPEAMVIIFALICLLACAYPSTWTSGLWSLRDFAWLWTFGIYTLVVLLYSPNTELAISKAIELMIVIASACLIYVVSLQRGFIDAFAAGALCLTAVLGIIGFATFSGERLAVLGGGPNVYARFMALGLFCVLYALDRGWFSKTLATFAAAAFAVLIVLTGSRGATLSTIPAALLWMSGSSFARRQKRWLLLMGIVCVIALAIVSARWPGVLSSRFGENLLRDPPGGVAVATRLGMYQEGIEFFLRSPLVGNGVNSFKALSRYGSYPHNFVIELLAEFGIVGMCLVSGFVLSRLARVPWSRWWGEPGPMLILSLFVFSFFASQFSGDLFDNRWVLLFPAMFPTVAREAIRVGDRYGHGPRTSSVSGRHVRVPTPSVYLPGRS